MKKQQRNILIAVAVLLLLYFWWDSTQTTEEDGKHFLINGNGNGNCTNTCCDGSGSPIMPSNYPECRCPQTDYVFSNNECVPSGVIGCMDLLATNFNASATINDPNSCNYGQQSHNCYTACMGFSYNTLNTTENCGSGGAGNYPFTSPPDCQITR